MVTKWICDPAREQAQATAQWNNLNVSLRSFHFKKKNKAYGDSPSPYICQLLNFTQLCNPMSSCLKMIFPFLKTNNFLKSCV